MKILQAIKSMDVASNKPTCPYNSEQDIVLFGITRPEAAERIQNVITSFVVQRKANASDILRAMCSHPDNGEQLNGDSELQVGDVVVIGAKEFEGGFIGAHGMIAVVTEIDPPTFDIYELTNTIRTSLCLHLGQQLSDSSRVSKQIRFSLSPGINAAAVGRFVRRNMDAGTAFRMRLTGSDIFHAFGVVSERLESQRRSLSRDPNSQASMHYGTYRCNNFVHDVVREALALRDVCYCKS